MSDSFHRLTAPTYYTGGPTFPSESGVTYDYINNGGSGTPSLTDGAKVGGPNAGTYFSAFGEDATSANFNRANLALAENDEHIDNLLHRSIAVPVRTVNATAVGAVSSIILPVDTFLGISGYTATAANLNRLFEITDDTDEEILEPISGLPVKVTSVTLGTGDAIGGGGANGSFSGNTVTLNLVPSIPTGYTYRVYYGTRTNLATIPLDALTSVSIKGAEVVDGIIEGLLQALHGGDEFWNDGWDATIHDLALGGLNERYRRFQSAVDTTPPEGYFGEDFDSGGAGAWIKRTGPAVTVYAYNEGAYADPMNALFAAKFFDHTPANSGGATGFVVYGSRQTGTAWTGETLNHTPGSLAFAHLWPHYFTSSLSITDPYTRIVDGAAANLTSHGTYNVNTGEAIVTVTSPNNYFRNGSSQSAVSIGHDLLEVTYLATTKYFVIVAHGETGDTSNPAKVRVRCLDGTVPDFSTNPSATIRWVSTTMTMGDGAGSLHDDTYSDGASSVKLGSFFYQVPPKLSTASDDDVTVLSPAFVARGISNTLSAFRWGGFRYTGVTGPVFAGFLHGDGSGTFDGAGITVAGGDVTVDTGDIDVTLGNITVPAGHIETVRYVETVNPSAYTSATSPLDIDVSLGVAWVLNPAASPLKLRFINVSGKGARFKIIGQGLSATTIQWGKAALDSSTFASTLHYFSTGDDQPAASVEYQMWDAFVFDYNGVFTIFWTLTRLDDTAIVAS